MQIFSFNTCNPIPLTLLTLISKAKVEMLNDMMDIFNNYDKYPGEGEDKFSKVEKLKGSAGY